MYYLIKKRQERVILPDKGSVNSIPDFMTNSKITYLKINGIDKFVNGIEVCYKDVLIHKLISHLILYFRNISSKTILLGI